MISTDLAIWYGILSGLGGLAIGLVAVGLLKLQVGVEDALVMPILGAMAVYIVILARLWRHFRWERLRPIMASQLLAVPVGVLFLAYADRAEFLAPFEWLVREARRD